VRANFVDTLLARLDGEVAPIWACALLRVDAPPPPAALRAALQALVDESPRLRLRWHGRRSWLPVERTPADLDAALLVDETPTAEAAAIDRAIAARADLARDLPLRVELTRMADPAGGAWLLAVALHHAVGDAKALGLLLERLWLHLGDAPAPPPPPSTQLTDAAVALAALRRPGALLRLAAPKYKLLAPRGVSLRREAAAGSPGRPILSSARLDLAGAGGAPASDIFFAAVLAAAADHAATDGIVRLRVPVDLRPALGLGRVLGNGCSAIPVEFTRAELLALRDDHAALARLARSRLSELLALDVHFTTALECLFASALPRRLLRRGARPGLLAARRTNTLVVTYVGSIDRHFAGAPLAVRSARTHTATWGVTGFCLDRRLTINVASFEGLWARPELDAFTRDLADWAASRFRLPPAELLP
jgi:hypothetical protein